MNSHIVKALKVRPFLFLWLAEVFSQIGVNMMNFILILVAYTLTRSNTAVSGIVVAFTLPAIVFGVLAGVYVDRWNKRNVLFATNATRAFFVFLLIFFHSNLAVIYALTFCITIATQFFIPAETPIIPNVVPQNLLLSANALFGVALYGSILIAYALSGPVLLLLGTQNSFLMLAFFFALAAILTLFVKMPYMKPRLKVNEELQIRKEIKLSFKHIFSVKEISNSFLLLSLSQVLILIIAVIGPGYAQHVLGISINQFPILFVTPAAIGMVAAAIIITNFMHNYSRRKMTILGLMLLSVCVFLLPFGSKVASRGFVLTLNAFLPHILQITILHIMVALAFLLGFANALVFVPSNTLIQEKTSEETRGKIYGVLNTVLAIFSLIPVIIAGSLADLFGVQTVLVIAAITLAVIAVLQLKSN